MKKILSFLSVALLLTAFTTSNAQQSNGRWSLGFGLSYPRYISTNVTADNASYGGYVSLYRDFSKHVSLRGNLRYAHIQGTISPGKNVKTDGASLDFDLIYYLAPTEVVSPFFMIGVGGVYASLTGRQTKKGDFVDYEVNLGFGANWKLAPKWDLTTSLETHSVANSHFDGVYGTTGGGIFGGNTDMYMSFDVGAKYYFGSGKRTAAIHGNKSIFGGVISTDKVNSNTVYDRDGNPVGNVIDYERIANIVQKYIPKEVVKEVVVEKPVPMKSNWVLVGVNFAYNSAKLKNESFPVLWHAVQVLLTNSDVRVEIQGYTDNIGSEKNNMKVAIKRAQTVKDYLMARGVSADRMIIKGYGEANPIASNKTAKGRSMNRRIEFKVLD